MTLDEPRLPVPANADAKMIVVGNTDFAFDLYARLRSDSQNLFFSPYSISSALAMTFGGARGETEAQMAQTLRFTLAPAQLHPAFAALDAQVKAAGERSNVVLCMANALWPQRGYGFLDTYLSLISSNYGVSITPVEYAESEKARAIINTWVEEKTQGRITNLIGEGVLDALTRLVLTNAVYFKGSWAAPFDPHSTRDAPFWLTPEKAVDVPTMALEAAFRIAVLDGLRILELPYGNGDLSMLLILPDRKDGLANLEETLTAENLRMWVQRLRKTKVKVLLPRFKMTSTFSLKHALISMGMADAFDMDKADFSGMDGHEQWLYIDAALHKAFVKVNEEGTEAAAATAVIMAAKSVALNTPTFRADHPFAFVIRDAGTGCILFLGRMADPR